MKLLFPLLALLWLITSPSAIAAENSSRPNVLFLFTDDQRADTIAGLGNPVIQTPNLDRLVKRGLTFDRAYMQGAMQGATCIPSRAMLLSGQPLFRVDEKLMRDRTWPTVFANSGYTTFMSGKWHNGSESIATNFQMARSVFLGGMTDPMKAPLNDLIEGRIGKTHLTPKHSCEVFADEAICFFTGHKIDHSSAMWHSMHRTIPTSFPKRFRSRTTPLSFPYRQISYRNTPGTTAT